VGEEEARQQREAPQQQQQEEDDAQQQVQTESDEGGMTEGEARQQQPPESQEGSRELQEEELLVARRQLEDVTEALEAMKIWPTSQEAPPRPAVPAAGGIGEEEASEEGPEDTQLDDSVEAFWEMMADVASDSDDEDESAIELPSFGKVWELLNAWWTRSAYEAYTAGTGISSEGSPQHKVALEIIALHADALCSALGLPRANTRRRVRDILQAFDCSQCTMPSFSLEEQRMLTAVLLHFAAPEEAHKNHFLEPVVGVSGWPKCLDGLDHDEHDALMSLLQTPPARLIVPQAPAPAYFPTEEADTCMPCIAEEEITEGGDVSDDEGLYKISKWAEELD